MPWDDSLISYGEKIRTQDAELITGKRQQGKVSTSSPKPSSSPGQAGRAVLGPELFSPPHTVP